MEISNKTIQNAMRITGAIVLILAVALVAYLAWLTVNVGMDLFLFMAFGVGIITMLGGGAMIYLSSRIVFEEVEKEEPRFIYTREPYMIARRCS